MTIGLQLTCTPIEIQVNFFTFKSSMRDLISSTGDLWSLTGDRKSLGGEWLPLLLEERDLMEDGELRELGGVCVPASLRDTGRGLGVLDRFFSEALRL